ncbi:phosphodiester glycosidase family protein [Metabacillus herbersteinensis]|uniref:Phosphodiester glycosidase family protein n=1 Tax=Metabacillus herbersteinensis TaxID=283816 RepID=A0ABV6GDK2_9BACI
MIRKLWMNVLLASLVTVPMVPSLHAASESTSVAQARSTSSDRTEPVTFVGPAGKTLVSDQKTMPIGPGIELTSFERFDARGWLNGEMMSVELANEYVSLGLLYPGAISSAKPLSEMAKTAGAIAGVNGDFFDINNTKAPLGSVIQNSQLLKGPEGSHTLTAGIDSNGIGRIANLLLDGSISLPNGKFPLAAFNQYGIPTNGIGLYTSAWGSKQRPSSSTSIYEVAVQDGKVLNVSNQPGSGPIGENTLVLVGREEGAEALKALSIGDEVSVDYSPKVDGNTLMSFAIGGNIKLLENGQVPLNLDDTVTAPRTAVGFSEDGKKMFLASVDGRQTDSRGMTYKELAELMKEYGAYNVLNLDGGGSTTMVARKPGNENAEVVNQPSDGFERSVPNGIGLFAKPGSGELKGFKVETVSEIKNGNRVFPGLSRTFKSHGYDENYAPVDAGNITWRALPSDVGSFEKDSVFRAKKSGSSLVEAKSKSAKGTMNITVIGELERIEATPSRLGLEMGVQRDFSLIGYDQNGYTAPVEPQDVNLEYDASVVAITENKDGGFTVVPREEGGSTLITASVQGHKTYLPVTIGLATKKMSDFEKISDWSYTKYPAAVNAAMDTVEGKTGKGLELSYDFSTTTATRAAYLQVNPMLELPGEVQKIGLWVYGDGNGAWLRTVVRDAANTSYTLTLASAVNWTGWKYVEASVPNGVRYPLKLWRIYPVETDRNKQYTGKMIFDDLIVKVPPTIDVPEQSQSPDPLIIQNGELGNKQWTFAVLADSQFVAKSPNSQQVQMARESLREIVKANPDFLVINGDFVDTAWKEDFDLAEQILEEEVGDKLPIYYIPGNHERMGPGTLENFINVYENNRYIFDHNGTRFILLDSSTGSYRTSDFEQLIDLKKSLDEAAADPLVKNVVVMAHHPTRDPLPTKNSQLSDRKESGLLEQWLTHFRKTSGGKGALYIGGHAHTVNVERVEGVPYMVVGPAGKIPYGPADEGGFYSWTLFGVDPTSGPDKAFGPEKAAEHSQASNVSWIQAEVRPMLESITMETPSTINASETVKIKALGHQVGDLTIPLRYPATVTWKGSDNVFVGTDRKLEQAEASGQYDALFNPLTGELKALHTSNITLKIEANGTIAEKEIVIK